MSIATLDPGILEEIDLIKEKTTGWPQQAKLLLIHTLTENPESTTAFGAIDEELADDDEFEITDEQYAELQRRSEEIESGKVKALSLEEFYANAEKALKNA